MKTGNTFYQPYRVLLLAPSNAETCSHLFCPTLYCTITTISSAGMLTKLIALAEFLALQIGCCNFNQNHNNFNHKWSPTKIMTMSWI